MTPLLGPNTIIGVVDTEMVSTTLEQLRSQFRISECAAARENVTLEDNFISSSTSISLKMETRSPVARAERRRCLKTVALEKLVLRSIQQHLRD